MFARVFSAGCDGVVGAGVSARATSVGVSSRPVGVRGTLVDGTSGVGVVRTEGGVAGVVGVTGVVVGVAGVVVGGVVSGVVSGVEVGGVVSGVVGGTSFAVFVRTTATFVSAMVVIVAFVPSAEMATFGSPAVAELKRGSPKVIPSSSGKVGSLSVTVVPAGRTLFPEMGSPPSGTLRT